MKFREHPALAQQPPTLPTARRAAFLGLACASALVAACAASSPVPPQNDPYFPATLALSPDTAESFLFIANANSDLKYGSGSVQVYDLAQVEQMASGWNGGAGALPADCTIDALRPELAHCLSTTADGARAGYVAAAAVQIGNFVSALRVQLMNGGSMRLFSAVRGDPSVTWMDFTPADGKLDCGGSGGFPRCDDRHRLQTMRNDEDLGVLLEEPFGMAIDGAREHVIVTHLTRGDVSLIHAPLDPAQPPTLQDRLTGIWAGNNSQNIVSAVAAAVRKPGDPTNLFYVTSRAEARINVVRAVDTVDAAGAPTARLVRADSFFYAPAPAGNGTDGDARGVAFSPEGDQAFVVSRTPASLMVFDTSIDPTTGTPRHVLTHQVALCTHLTAGIDGGGPDALAVVDVNDDPAVFEPRVYVTCFDIGQIWVVDTDRGRLESTIPVGRGPDSFTISAVHKQAYVGNYGDDTISVIDLDTQSPTYQHAVLQLGELRGEN
jgi:DNA-binding beta-propeller fold protein YncE